MIDTARMTIQTFLTNVPIRTKLRTQSNPYNTRTSIDMSNVGSTEKQIDNISITNF